MKKLAACVLMCGLVASPALADEPVSFKGKTVTMIIGFPPGGGTDLFGRAVAVYLEKHLPGNPTVVAKNVPGADGITAMNFIVQQTAPDGLTVTTSANTAADPLNYRKPQVHYVPTDFEIVGGGGRGGEVLLINKEAEKRLHDKSASPVVMGSLGGIPRSGMQMTAWGIELLDWNAKWVIGYRGTNELMLALERGEIDMTATGNFHLIQKLLNTGKFKILVQSGTLKDGVLAGRPEFGDAPLLTDLVEGKMKDPVAAKAFEYWRAIALTDKWIALAPKTPKNIVEAYRAAYAKVSKDPEFLASVRKVSEDFVPLEHSQVEKLVQTLAALPPEATAYMTTILKKQGLDVK
jgi:tripartite-type tricarboxylate transporter receptor subunit TctC